jgi:hypothetical protein
MKKPLIALAAGLAAAASLTLGASAAVAGPRAVVAVSVGGPGYYAPVQYVAPYRAYARPPVVYAAPVYVDPYAAHRARVWRERELRRQYWREMQWRRHHLHRYGY